MSTPLRDEYDWVVLGDHPAALFSGVMVARLGLSVLFAGLDRRPQVSVSRHGVLHDPESSFVPGLGSWAPSTGGADEPVPGLWRRLLQDFTGEQSAVSAPWLETPDHRVQALREETSWAWECQRESLTTPPSTLAELSYWSRYAERFQLEEGKKKASLAPPKVSAAALSPELRNAFRFLNRGKSINQGGLNRMSTPADVTAARTGWSVGGGMAAFRHTLVKLAEKSGAHCPSQFPCRRVFIRDGKLVGLQLFQHGKMISVKGGVLGVSVRQLLPYLSYEAKARVTLKKAPALESWLFTIGVRVPVGRVQPFLRQWIWQEQGAPPIQLETVRREEYGGVDPGFENLLIRSALPPDPATLTVKGQRVIAARMFRQVCQVVPFLEENVTSIYPDFRLGTPDEDSVFSRLYPYRSFDEIPESLSIPSAGLGVQSGIGQLFLATGEVDPDAGMVGALHAAIEASAWIAHKQGLRGPLSQENA